MSDDTNSSSAMVASGDASHTKKQGCKARAAALMEKNANVKSPTIRALWAEGFDRTQIATALGIRYQHVRNVLITPLTSKK